MPPPTPLFAAAAADAADAPVSSSPSLPVLCILILAILILLVTIRLAAFAAAVVVNQFLLVIIADADLVFVLASHEPVHSHHSLHGPLPSHHAHLHLDITSLIHPPLFLVLHN
jgi:hypothetical protein